MTDDPNPMPTWRRWLRPAVWGPALLFLAGAGAGVAWGAWQNLCADCPSIAQIRTFEPEQTSKLFSHDGRLIAEFGVESRTPVSLDSLPDFVGQAFVAVEDRRFYEHGGVDPRGIARAVFGVLTGRNLGGGSTITQQLARNMFTERIGFERRITRKLKELQVALALERSYTKDQILEAYINQINYGHGWYGIQTAARNYFGKNASELNPAEAALLAAVPNRPGTYSPFRHPDNALRRRNLVLRRMVEQGYLPREELERWTAVPVPTERGGRSENIAPYFVEWARQILDDRFGSRLYTSGLRIYTTLDVRMQRAAEAAMQWGWDTIEARESFSAPRYEEFAGKPASEVLVDGGTPYLQGLLIALDPWSGHVRAMIGGRDFSQSKFNRATQARRQAGSGFKPFVYGAAIASGIPPNHIVVDAPIVRMQVDGTEWRPRNFSANFRGPITIREGLMRSINMIAIKLAEEVGLESVAQTARRMGIRTEIERFPSTAIGAVEVIPIEMSEAYSAFANLGTRVRPFPILRVEDARGRVIWRPQPERQVAMDSLPARIMVSMLETVVEEGTGYTAIRLRARLPREVAAAGKTGTTNDGTDVWFNGFTPNLLATVWFGLDKPVPFRENATGGADAAPVWGRFVKAVYYGDPEAVDPEMREPMLPVPEPWPIPDGLSRRVIDRTTGKLASRWCPEENQRVELFLPGTEPTEFCDQQSLFDARPIGHR
ncbi:MAG: PBP1A family penicillin-binding protein [Gemmatimonadetes bacterium]|nr:MAG: PBP1A family penicillin-binding protein [Gemmatimonadota bacterium]